MMGDVEFAAKGQPEDIRLGARLLSALLTVRGFPPRGADGRPTVIVVAVFHDGDAKVLPRSFSAALAEMKDDDVRASRLRRGARHRRGRYVVVRRPGNDHRRRTGGGVR